MEVSNETSDMG